jgi:hypothetical protein
MAYDVDGEREDVIGNGSDQVHDLISPALTELAAVVCGWRSF